MNIVLSPEASTVLPGVDRQQLAADFEALAAITEPHKPWTRRSFSPLFLEGREFLKARFAEEGLTVRLDTAGNLIGRLEGANPAAPVIMTGSHSDTVPGGGRFDGIAGILCGLAAIRALKAAGHGLHHPLELVDFLAEEPSEWGLSCIGSRGMAGALGDGELALAGPGGETLAHAITRIGGDSAQIAAARRSDVAAFVELHIEQGPVLEARGVPVGIVSGIAGICRLKVRFEGVPAHAGTAPMDMRADASLAAARFALGLRNATRDQQATGLFTATAGVWQIEPGGANVVPGAAEITVDIRAESDAAMTAYLTQLAVLAQSAADAESCRLTRLQQLSRTRATPCDPALQAVIAEAARALGHASLPLASGAGHDAAFLARITRSAMIFAPSHEGRSHCPEEWTEPEDLARAADVLALTLMQLDRQRHDAGRG
ncbi:Zn-dependent hydrolase [Radicibacter daui]|uniref:Zn-dependent hydrolase n=1 Tax=Radicibacter daui TaxID=3064829 RepID=UPI004046E7AE